MVEHELETPEVKTTSKLKGLEPIYQHKKIEPTPIHVPKQHKIMDD